MIIVFSGTDGAGKSTQIDSLRQYFLQRHQRVVCLWSRGGYTPLFSLAKRVVRKLLQKKLPQQGQSTGRDKMLKQPAISAVWLALAILDLILLYGVYVRLLNFFGAVVICDRYLDDTRIDFNQNFSQHFNEQGFLWSLLTALTPKPNHAFLLYVEVEVSQYRSTLKNEPFPDSKETLAFRLANYLDDALFPAKNYEKIHCVNSIENIHQAIIATIMANKR